MNISLWILIFALTVVQEAVAGGFDFDFDFCCKAEISPARAEYTKMREHLFKSCMKEVGYSGMLSGRFTFSR